LAVVVNKIVMQGVAVAATISAMVVAMSYMLTLCIHCVIK